MLNIGISFILRCNERSLRSVDQERLEENDGEGREEEERGESEDGESVEEEEGEGGEPGGGRG